MRSAYPLMGGLAGGAAGSLGGPVIGGLSAGAGVLAGEALKNKDALIEAEEKIVALSHGDVDALLNAGLAEHKTGFDAFTSYIKKILIGAAVSSLVDTSPFQYSWRKELPVNALKPKRLNIKLAHHFLSNLPPVHEKFRNT